MRKILQSDWLKSRRGSASIAPEPGTFYTGSELHLTATTNLRNPVFVWSGENAATILSGQGSDELTFWSSIAGSSDVSVRIGGSGEAYVRWSGTIEEAQTTLTPPAVSHYNTLSDYVFTVASDLNPSTIVWSVTNGTIQSGQGTTSVTVRFTTPYASAQVAVSVTGLIVHNRTYDLTPIVVPTEIPNLVVWYDASDATTITTDISNNVEQWRDKSGNAIHLGQGSSTRRPAYVADAKNGHAVVQNDGIDDILETASQTAGTFFGSGGTEITVVTAHNIFGGIIGWRLSPTTGDVTNYLHRQRSTTNGWNATINSVFNKTTLPHDDTGWCIETVRWKSGEKMYTRRIRGGITTQHESDTTFTATWSAANTKLFMGRGLGNDLWTQAGSCFVFSRRLASGEIDLLTAYLVDLWGAI